jgi:hypothetical protein
MSLRPIGLTGGLPGFLPGLPSADVSAHDLAAPDRLSRFGAHGRQLQRRPHVSAIHEGLRLFPAPPLRIGQDGRTTLARDWNLSAR